MSEVFTITDSSLRFDFNVFEAGEAKTLDRISIRAVFALGAFGELSYEVKLNDTAVAASYSYQYVSPSGDRSAFNGAYHFPSAFLDRLQQEHGDANFLMASLRTSELKDLLSVGLEPALKAAGVYLRGAYPESVDEANARLRQNKLEPQFQELEVAVKGLQFWAPSV